MRIAMRRFGVLVAAGAVLVACSSPSSRDFQTRAKEFLQSDGFFETYGLDVPEPACSEPGSTDTGEPVVCSATAQDGQGYTFTFEITSSTELMLRSIDFGAASQPPVAVSATTEP